MKADVQLSDIEKVISFCLHPENEAFDVFSLPWVYQRLSWFSRFWGYCGAKKRAGWLEKHLFPILLEVSIPYLERFSAGNWLSSEESSLKNIFDYFSLRIDACRQKISPSLETFLLGPTPSFFQERGRMQSLGTTKQGYQWYRDETYSQYKNRLKQVCGAEQERGGSAVVDKEEKEVLKPERRDESFRQRSGERIEKFIGHFQELKEECVRCNYQLDKDLAKAFPLRKESGSPVHEIQEAKEDLLDLLLSIEDALSKLIESFAAMTDEYAHVLFEEADVLLKSFRATFRYIQNRSAENRVAIEEKQMSLNKEIQKIIQSIDRVRLLPVSSAFRVHQSRLIRMARDRIKTFRERLVRGPGPEVQFCFLEKDIFLLIELAQDFYAEGHEVCLMQERLTRYSRNIEKIIEKKGSTNALKNILNDIAELERTLEVSADRKKHFDKIVYALSRANIQIDEIKAEK